MTPRESRDFNRALFGLIVLGAAIAVMLIFATLKPLFE